MKINVILASASPRRRELLQYIFSDFEIKASSVEEIVPSDISSKKYPEYLSKLKAEDIAKEHFDALVIGADTIVLLGEKILGKPKDKEDSREMLSSLSGNIHKVITGCTLVYKGKSLTFSVTTDVEFYNLTDDEIEEYISSDEPYDKAGGYGIQSKGALLVKKIDGDYFNVVGFPIAELKRKIAEILS